MKTSNCRSGLGVILSLLLVLAVGQAQALQILTFDTRNPGRYEVSGGMGFTITKVGSEAAPDLDLSLFDLIYVAPPISEFLSSLGLQLVDLDDFVSNGGSIVFGSSFQVPGLPTGSGLPGLPSVDVQEEAPSQVTAVPEPGTLALFGMGIAGLLFYRRGRKSRA